jgi:hypothetical protein
MEEATPIPGLAPLLAVDGGAISEFGSTWQLVFLTEFATVNVH